MRTANPWPVAALAAVMVLAAAVPARTAPAKAPAKESPRQFMAEIKFGPWRPDVDKEFKTKTPWKDTFGSGLNLITMLEIDWEFFHKVGVIALGGSVGYSQASGHGLLEDGTKSSDSTKFHLMPLGLSLIYRFDYLAQRYRFPFVPYVKGGLDAYLWWALNGQGDVSKAADGVSGKGATFGGHATAGLMFLLDALAPMMAQTFDTELGVNNTYLFAEFTWNWIDDFGSKSSMDLSSRTFMAGLAIEF